MIRLSEYKLRVLREILSETREDHWEEDRKAILAIVKEELKREAKRNAIREQIRALQIELAELEQTETEIILNKKTIIEDIDEENSPW